MKVKAKAKNGVVKVKMLLKHNMDSGQAKDKKTGEKIPAHYITDVTAKLGDADIFHAELGPAVSKNPYLAFQYKGEAGGKITVSWVDNKGGSKSTESVVK